jgi:hypothetical protein
VRLAAAFAIAFAWLFAAAAGAQTVPEGIHSVNRGPSEVCGITAASAAEFQRLVESDGRLERQGGTPLFQIYARGTDNEFFQWALTTAVHPAHPTATCRHVYRDGDAWMSTRRMRCDSSRALCDRIFLEFQELDRRAREALTGN